MYRSCSTAFVFFFFFVYRLNAIKCSPKKNYTNLLFEIVNKLCDNLIHIFLIPATETIFFFLTEILLIKYVHTFIVLIFSYKVYYNIVIITKGLLVVFPIMTRDIKKTYRKISQLVRTILFFYLFCVSCTVNAWLLWEMNVDINTVFKLIVVSVH